MLKTALSSSIEMGNNRTAIVAIAIKELLSFKVGDVVLYVCGCIKEKKKCTRVFAKEKKNSQKYLLSLERNRRNTQKLVDNKHSFRHVKRDFES